MRESEIFFLFSGAFLFILAGFGFGFFVGYNERGREIAEYEHRKIMWRDDK